MDSAATRTADEHASSEITPTATDRPISSNLGTSQTPADDLKKIYKVALPIGLFISVTCTTLVVNPITPKLLFFLLDLYYILLNLSLIIGIGLALISIKNGGSNSISASSTADHQVVWMKRLMITGFATTSLTLLLRSLMVHSYSHAWYVVFMIIGTAFLYLFMLWMLKRPSLFFKAISRKKTLDSNKLSFEHAYATTVFLQVDLCGDDGMMMLVHHD